MLKRPSGSKSKTISKLTRIRLESLMSQNQKNGLRSSLNLTSQNHKSM